MVNEPRMDYLQPPVLQIEWGCAYLRYFYLGRDDFQNFRPNKARTANVTISNVIPRGW